MQGLHSRSPISLARSQLTTLPETTAADLILGFAYTTLESLTPRLFADMLSLYKRGPSPPFN